MRILGRLVTWPFALVLVFCSKAMSGTRLGQPLERHIPPLPIALLLGIPASIPKDPAIRFHEIIVYLQRKQNTNREEKETRRNIGAGSKRTNLERMEKASKQPGELRNSNDETAESYVRHKGRAPDGERSEVREPPGETVQLTASPSFEFCKSQAKEANVH